MSFIICDLYRAVWPGAHREALPFGKSCVAGDAERAERAERVEFNPVSGKVVIKKGGLRDLPSSIIERVASLVTNDVLIASNPRERIRISSFIFTIAIAVFNLGSSVVRAQSSAKGTVLIKEDFSGGERRTEPKLWGGGLSWNIPETWEIRDGAIACIYDGKAHPGKAHGRSLDPKFKAHNLRVSYRIQFEAEGASMDMIINAPLRPGQPGGVLWHIGDVVTRINQPTSRDDVSIGERDFTRDASHPKLAGKKLDPAVLEKPEGTFGSAYGIPGESAFRKVGLVTGKWYRFVVENIGAKWTLWVDGEETLSLNLKRSDVQKESINFIGFGPFVLDDIIIEELPH